MRTICIRACVVSASHLLVFPVQYPVQWSAVGPVATISSVDLPCLHPLSSTASPIKVKQLPVKAAHIFIHKIDNNGIDIIDI